ncbi:MAG: hypothetical protein HN377_09575, partial [Alphaproteobacteria bacterium]|nr:hypothetical protein [Alphaproteobacteria bacterium]
IARSRIFLLLFFAVSWLQYPVGQSPSLRASRATIISQPPGRRFLYMSFGVHILGSVLNLAGLSLLATMVERQKDPHLRRRLTMALINGFGTASSWSPFFIGMIVILVSIPSLEWVDIGPLGVSLALVMIFTGWVFDRLVLRRSVPAETPQQPVALARADFWRAAAILSSLIVLALAIVEVAGTSIPVTLGLMGPPFAIVWYMMIGAKGARFPFRAQSLTVDVLSRLPTLRNEALVFVAANIFGVGVASAIPTADLGAVVNAALPWADAKIAVLIAFFLGTSLIGLHPVITVIFLSSVLPPDILGLQDWVVGLTYVGVWGISTMVSPFSGTTLYMARVTNVPAHIIGWRWMLPLVAINGTLIAGMVIAIRHLLG